MTRTIELPTQRFRTAGFDVEVSLPWLPADPAAAVAKLVDPERSEETLHWGRNYLYLTRIELGHEHRLVVVKQFSHQGWRSRLRRRFGGSKAVRSWKIARELQRHEVPTPEPVMVIEAEGGSSFYVSAALDHFFEMRYYFRALAASTDGETFPEVDALELFEALGRAVRRVHEAGVWHRDVTIGNLLVRYERGPVRPPAIYLVDLNRARAGRPPSLLERARDLCRLPIRRPALLEAFLRAYWDHPEGPLGWRLALYRLVRGSFESKNRLKAAIRRPGGWLKRQFGPRTAHEHIPDADADAARRDRAVWDPLSDQPHQHAGRLQRAAIRLTDVGAHLGDGGRVVAAAPRIWRAYRRLARERNERLPRAWGEPGIAIDGAPRDPAETLSLLGALGVPRVLVRLHPWAPSLDPAHRLCLDLHSRGYELAFAVPQNRELVRDPARWRSAIEEIAERFVPLGRDFQIGQAINRSKWGIWKYSEFERLATTAMAVLRARGDVVVWGPGVIDFELHATAAVVNRSSPGYFFDGLASLLYVDRRGAPENPQLGFDTLDKVTLARAIAETGHSVGDRSWITEVNWPLFEGPHAPAGSEVAVREPKQADYLARYYLLALASGAVERVYWWQLTARGYGLVDPREDGTLRRRSAFDTLSTLNRVLGGSTFLGDRSTVPDTYLYHFRLPDDDEVVVAWCRSGSSRAPLPRPAIDALDRDGVDCTAPTGLEVEADGSPRYYRLER